MLKIIGILTMLLDHIGYIFESELSEKNYLFLRIIGRIAFPIFAYQLSIGFVKTRNIYKYGMRLFLWGIIAQIPFYLAHSVKIENFSDIPFDLFSLYGSDLNIFFTLFLSLLALFSLNKVTTVFSSEVFSSEVFSSKKIPSRDADTISGNQNLISLLQKFAISLLFALLFCLCFVAAEFLQVDYGSYGITLAVLFYLFRHHKSKMILAYLLLHIFTLYLWTLDIQWISTLQVFSCISLMFIGRHIPENDSPHFLKYLFYAFYPIHLVILIILKRFFTS